jgi:hypothetical protein
VVPVRKVEREWMEMREKERERERENNSKKFLEST